MASLSSTTTIDDDVDISSGLSVSSTRSSGFDGNLKIATVTIPHYQTQHSPDNEKFTTYSLLIVTCDGDEWTVYRRYSQFLKLHNSLPDHIKTTLTLPGKKYNGHLHDTFVTKRMKGLELYTQLLIESDIKGTDVGSFLGCDLHSRPQTKGRKPSALKNKNMTEFNWVHRTGGMESNASPGGARNNASRSSTNGKQKSTNNTQKGAGGDARSGGGNGGCILL